MRTLTNWFGNSAPSSLANCAFSLTVPVVGSIWLSTVSSVPAASFVFCSRSQASTGSFSPARSALQHRRQAVLRDGEDHRDRLQLRDHHQAVGVARVHDVAGVDLAQAEAPADRRGDAA